MAVPSLQAWQRVRARVPGAIHRGCCGCEFVFGPIAGRPPSCVCLALLQIFQRVRITLLIAPSIQRMMALSLPVCFKQNSEEPYWPLPGLHLGRSSVEKRITSCSRLYHRHHDCLLLMIQTSLPHLKSRFPLWTFRPFGWLHRHH